MHNDYTPIVQEVEEFFSKPAIPNYNLPVSIVIPVYNRRDKLFKTIAAIVHQSYPAELIEVIIADDGSSDSPEDAIELFKSNLSIKHVHQEDLGYRLSEVRNLGVDTAKHEHIIILDCDMLPEPQLVESYMRFMHVTDQAILVGPRRYVNSDNITFQNILTNINSALSLPSVCNETGMIPEGDQQPSVDWRYLRLYPDSNDLRTSRQPFRAFCGGNVCFSKHLIERIGKFDESFTAWGGEDTEFGYRAYLEGYYFVPVNEAMALHQEPPNGSNETDREGGRAITNDMVVEKVPNHYRKYRHDRIYERPKVSIYVPVFNAVEYIEMAIDSALDQTYTDLEVVIVDDGSTDGTAKLIHSLYSDNPRVVIISQVNGGISAASNTAVRACRGEFVVQLDSDDILLPQAIEKLLEVAEGLDVGFVYGDSYLITDDGSEIGPAYSWSVYDRGKLLDGMMIHHPRMFRMRDFNRTTGFDETLSNAVDYDFFLKLSEVTDGYHLQVPLYLYRQHTSNTSKINTTDQDANTHRAIEMALERLGIRHRLELSQNQSSRRRLTKQLIDDGGDFRLDMVATFTRLGISNPVSRFQHSWQLDELVHDSLVERQRHIVLHSNSRWLNIGPYSNHMEAIDALEVVNKLRGSKGELVVRPLGDDERFIIQIPAGQYDKTAIEIRRELVSGHGLNAEVVGRSGLPRWKSNITDTRSDFIAWKKKVTTSAGEGAQTEIRITHYPISKHWSQQGRTLIFRWSDEEVFFQMPRDFELSKTHGDLLRLAHYVMVAPWDKSILDGWQPTRLPGWRPGIALSGGLDSTASLFVIPQFAIPIYNERVGIEGKLSHNNAFRFFDELERRFHRKTIRVKSNHEKIRMREGKMAGFSTDYACAVQVILLADHFSFDSIVTGMPLENSYFFHGYKHRDFGDSWFWKHHSTLFQQVGLAIYQPVAGCSELITMRIVEKNGLTGWAQSCLRSMEGGQICGQCWKCFRKNSLIGHPITISNEIKAFLAKKPLKQAISTLYSIQKCVERGDGKSILKSFPDVAEQMGLDLSWLERYYADSLELLPEKYREFTKLRLDEYADKMTEADISKMESIDLYPNSD
jgi:chondroitin synthase